MSIKVKINKRLLKEWKSLNDETDPGIRYGKDPNNKQKIDVYLSLFDKDTNIHKELEKYKIKEVHFEVTIPDKYPFAPPFVRIVSPRFQGYKGFITTGGSLCLDIITASAWSPAYSIDRLFIQIREFVKDGIIDPVNYKKEYTMEEAQYHYNSTTKIHGWGKKK